MLLRSAVFMELCNPQLCLRRHSFAVSPDWVKAVHETLHGLLQLLIPFYYLGIKKALLCLSSTLGLHMLKIIAAAPAAAAAATLAGNSCLTHPAWCSCWAPS
jgi:hypothetical protein